MDMKEYKYQMKPAFEERMRELLPEAADFERYSEIIHQGPRDFIRCNTLKITPEELLEKLNARGWNVVQPFKGFPEIMLVTSNLGPGELGNALEHQLGYFYIQEVSSMLPVLALDPRPGEFVLDLCASPGSKTSQMAARMENKGTIIANDLKVDRIMILAANLERCGVMNTVVTKNDAIGFCVRFADSGFKFDKILLDVPCTGEGTLRSNTKLYVQWNEKVLKKLSRQQKKFIALAFKCLKKGGTLVYSTCTHGPEENEEVVSFALNNFPVKMERVHLPLKCRPGVTSWRGEEFNAEVEKSCRIYPQDNDSEGFFVSKFTLLEEVK